MGLIKPEMRKKKGLGVYLGGGLDGMAPGGLSKAVPSPRDGEELAGLEGEKSLLEQQRPKEWRR